MSLFDIDYNKTGQQLLPPDKRGFVMISWLSSLLKPMQWIADLWLRDYRIGSSASLWLNSTTYAKYEKVKYNFCIYESLVDGNLNNTPDSSPLSWMLVQENFIGLSERIRYTGITLTLTYALNKRFATVFRQPPNISDIYVGNNVIPFPPFIFGGNEENSSSFFSLSSTEFFINAYSFTDNYNFSIYVPVATYDALDPLPINREKIFRSFVNGIIPAGITYNIITY